MSSSVLSMSRPRAVAVALFVSIASALSLLTAPEAKAAGFSLVFQDNFNGSSLDRSKWGVFNGNKRNDRVAENVFVNNGMLTLRTKPVNGKWKGAGVSAARANQQKYGKYEIRVRFDAGFGVRCAGLLWPANGSWPPEVDFYEIPGTNANRSINTVTNHYGTRSNHKMQHGQYSGDFTKWHTVGVEWTPNELRYTMDGKVMLTQRGHIPKTSMWFGIQTKAGLNGKVPNGSTPRVVDLDVDWVKIYKYNG